MGSLNNFFFLFPNKKRIVITIEWKRISKIKKVSWRKSVKNKTVQGNSLLETDKIRTEVKENQYFNPCQVNAVCEFRKQWF